jgi:hypothetical protein
MMVVTDEFNDLLKTLRLNSFVVNQSGVEVIGIAVEHVLEVKYLEIN